MPPPPLPKTRSVQPSAASTSMAPTFGFPSVWWKDLLPFPGTTDKDRFPERSDLSSFKDPRRVFGSLNFVLALTNAQVLRIVDPHFDMKHGAATLERAIAQSTLVEIYLLTGSNSERTQEWCTEICRSLVSGVNGKAPVVEWKTTLRTMCLFDIHDRFALVDNGTWHFGATVGGGHPSINAYSRGWDAAKSRAIEFFNEIWNYA